MGELEIDNTCIKFIQSDKWVRTLSIGSTSFYKYTATATTGTLVFGLI